LSPKKNNEDISDAVYNSIIHKSTLPHYWNIDGETFFAWEGRRVLEGMGNREFMEEGSVVLGNYMNGGHVLIAQMNSKPPEGKVWVPMYHPNFIHPDVPDSLAILEGEGYRHVNSVYLRTFVTQPTIGIYAVLWEDIINES